MGDVRGNDWKLTTTSEVAVYFSSGLVCACACVLLLVCPPRGAFFVTRVFASYCFTALHVCKLCASSSSRWFTVAAIMFCCMYAFLGFGMCLFEIQACL